MIAWLYNFLFHSCRHEWEVKTWGRIYGGWSHSSDEICGHYYIQRCTKCGKLKRVRL